MWHSWPCDHVLNFTTPQVAERPISAFPSGTVARLRGGSIHTATVKKRETSPNSAGPWMWQSKTAIRTIRISLDGENSVPSALLVYFALTEEASNKQSSAFVTTRAWLGQMTGLSVRTIQSRLKDLQEIGLIEVKTTRLKTPSMYTLLDVQPLPNAVQPLKTREFHSSEESEKNLTEESPNNYSFKLPTRREIKNFADENGIPIRCANRVVKLNNENGWSEGWKDRMILFYENNWCKNYTP